MKLTKSAFSQRPELFVREGRKLRINFDIEEENVKNEQGEYTQYKAYSIRVSMPINYSDIVSSIINAGYPEDEMQAIINNHLADSSDLTNESEYEMMQFWRKHAKEIAQEVVDAYQESLKEGVL